MPTNEPGQALAVMTLLSSVVYAFLGVLLMLGAYRLFDIIHPVDFNQELKNGNVAAGVAAAGILVGVAIIVAAAIL